MRPGTYSEIPNNLVLHPDLIGSCPEFPQALATQVAGAVHLKWLDTTSIIQEVVKYNGPSLGQVRKWRGGETIVLHGPVSWLGLGSTTELDMPIGNQLEWTVGCWPQ